MAGSQRGQAIPTKLSVEQFEQFVLPHLSLEFSPYLRSTRPAPPPNNLELLLDTAALLSEGFDYVRIDLYAPTDEVFFGELTFTPGAGVGPMRPDRVDFEWGRLLT